MITPAIVAREIRKLHRKENSRAKPFYKSSPHGIQHWNLSMVLSVCKCKDITKQHQQKSER